MDELSSGSGADSSTLVTNEYLGVGALFQKRRGKSARQLIRDKHRLFARLHWYRCSCCIRFVSSFFLFYNGHTDLDVACGELVCVDAYWLLWIQMEGWSQKKKNSLVYCWWKLPRPTVLSTRWFIIESLRNTEYKLLHSLKHKVSLLFNSLNTSRSTFSFYGKDTDCVWLVNIWMKCWVNTILPTTQKKKLMKSYFDALLCG